MTENVKGKKEGALWLLPLVSLSPFKLTQASELSASPREKA